MLPQGSYVEPSVKCSPEICTICITATKVKCVDNYHGFCKKCIDKWFTNHEICSRCNQKIPILLIESFTDQPAPAKISKRRQEIDSTD
jgi:hypothetical protein